MDMTFKLPATGNQMKYLRHYLRLIERAMLRELGVNVYAEKHHIYPKCMYGDNRYTVRLLPEEHYVAHQLLTKIYPDNRGLAYSAYLMARNRPGNKMYGWVRRRLSDVAKLRKHSEETREKLSKSLTGRVLPEEVKRKIGIAHRGMKRSEQTKHRMKGRVVSDETRDKLRKANTGYIHTEEAKKKMSEAKKGKPGHKHDDETKRRISKALIGHSSAFKGKTHSDEAKRKIGEASRNRWAKKRGELDVVD